MTLSNSELALDIQQYFEARDLDRLQFRNWLVGTAFGGPNGDGRYPMTDISGFTQLYDCPARVALNAQQIPIVNFSGNYLQLTNEHIGKQLIISSTSLITVAIPASFAYPSAMILLMGEGAQIQVTTQSGATMRNWQGHNASYASLANISLRNDRANVWTLAGTTTVL